MIIFVPIFLMLFAGWMLWGWTVGESKNIRWMRHWCAPAFVVTAMLLSAGAGGVAAMVLTKTTVRRNVTQLLEAIKVNIQNGQSQRVVAEIEATDLTGDPDAPDFDLLKHLPVMEDNLSESGTAVAESHSATRR